jgi:DNA polymerase-3 subunit gamma/tau
MRDAQSLLDQIISFGGQDIAQDDVRDVLGFIPGEILDRTTAALAEQDSRELLECISIIVDQGLSVQQYVRECIGRMRDLLMMKLGLDDKVLGGADDKKLLLNAGSRFSEQDLIRNFDMLLRLESEIKWTSQPRFHLEAGMVKLAKAGLVRNLEEVIRDFRQGLPGPPATAAPAPVKAPAVSAAAVAPPRPIPSPKPAPLASAPAPSSPPPATNPPAATRASSGAMDAAKDEPLVKRFLEVFRGDIAQVKPQVKPEIKPPEIKPTEGE